MQNPDPELDEAFAAFFLRSFGYPEAMRILRDLCSSVPPLAAEHHMYSDPDLGIGSYLIYNVLRVGASV